MKSPQYLNDNFNSLSLEYFKFIFDQSEKFLSRLVTVSENITKKAHAILVISVSLLTLSLSGVFTLKDSQLIASSVLLCVMSLLVILLLLKPLVSYSLSVPGTPPNKLIDKDFIVNFSSQENIVKNLFLTEILDYQDRIDSNAKQNKQRIHYVDAAMLLLVAAPFISWLFGIILG